MKRISEFIEELDQALREYGDLELRQYDPLAGDKSSYDGDYAEPPEIEVKRDESGKPICLGIY